MKSSELPRTPLSFYKGFILDQLRKCNTLRPSAELDTLKLRSLSIDRNSENVRRQNAWFFLLLSTKKKVHSNISNLNLEHQNKLLACKFLRIRLLQSDKCLNASNEGICCKCYEF